MKAREAKRKIEGVKEFGNIQRYAVVVYRGKLYIWKNDGQVPSTRSLSKIERLSGTNGYATWVGVFDPDEAVGYLDSLGYLPKKEVVL